MTTRTFPIFRSLQRAIDGSVVVAHKPAIAVTARQLYQGKEEETKDDETEKGSDDEPRLPEGHLLNDAVEGNDNDGIQKNNYPGKWPINSEKARQLRRDFVQEGYRRLYNIASAQSLTVMGGTIDAIGNDVDENVQRSSGQHEGEGLAGAWRRIVGPEPVDLTEDHETPREIIPINVDEDWVYYAQ